MLFKIRNQEYGDRLRIRDMAIEELVLNKKSNKYDEALMLLKDELNYDSIINCPAILRGLSKELKISIDRLTDENVSQEVEDLNQNSNLMYK